MLAEAMHWYKYESKSSSTNAYEKDLLKLMNISNFEKSDLKQ